MTPRRLRRLAHPPSPIPGPLGPAAPGEAEHEARPGSSPTRRPVLTAVVAALVVLGGALAPQPARAQTVGEKRAEAARLAEELDRQGTRLSEAAERFNQAEARAAEVQRQVEDTAAEVARATGRLDEARTRLAEAAVAAYTGTDGGVIGRLLLPEGNDTVLRSQYLRLASADQTRVLGEVRAAREDLGLRQEALAEQRSAAGAAVAEAAAGRQAAADAEAAQRAVLARVQGELAELVAQETAARERAQAAAAPAPARAPARTPAAAAPATAAAPAPATANAASDKGAIAVAEARRQIGKPYRWGGAGPDSFDCSGLTAWAWKAAGVYLPHSAYLQYVNTPRVAVADIRPGDLLFFGPSVAGIHHNAIYVGDGQMIEASQTGVPVRYRGWRAKDLVGIGRPG